MPNFRNQATGSLTANGQSVSMDWREFFNGGIGVQVTGTWTGTLEAQISLDGVNFRPILLRATSTESTASTMTANNIWYANVVGARIVRVAATAAMTGTAEVTLVGLPG